MLDDDPPEPPSRNLRGPTQREVLADQARRGRLAQRNSNADQQTENAAPTSDPRVPSTYPGMAEELGRRTGAPTPPIDPNLQAGHEKPSDAARDLEQIRSGKILPKNWSGASQDRAQSERPSEKTAVPYPSSETASPMHARDRRLYVILAWSAIPAALIVGCYIAWGSSQLPDAWAIAGIAVGLLAMAGATIYALEKKPPSPRYPGPIMIAVAALTWALIGWQTWMFFHSSTGVSPEKWAALTPSQTEALASRARFIPAEDIVVACETLNCKDLADEIAEILRKTPGWKVSILHRGGFDITGVAGIRLNPNEPATAALKDAIEATTGLAVTLGPDTQKYIGSGQSFLVVGTRPF